MNYPTNTLATPAELFTLEEMLERFVYIESTDSVQDLKNPQLHNIVPMRQFVKSHRSSKSVAAPGKGHVETTKLWEHSPLRKQARVAVGLREHIARLCDPSQPLPSK